MTGLAWHYSITADELIKLRRSMGLTMIHPFQTETWLACMSAWLLFCLLACLLTCLLTCLHACPRTPLDSLECSKNSFSMFFWIMCQMDAHTHLDTLGWSQKSLFLFKVYIWKTFIHPPHFFSKSKSGLNLYVSSYKKSYIMNLAQDTQGVPKTMNVFSYNLILSGLPCQLLLYTIEKRN